MKMKEKKSNLTLAERYDILHRIENGEKRSKISKKFKINRNTLTQIAQKKTNIQQYVKENMRLDLKKFKRIITHQRNQKPIKLSTNGLSMKD
jgi:hypothetical protein